VKAILHEKEDWNQDASDAESYPVKCRDPNLPFTDNWQASSINVTPGWGATIYEGDMFTKKSMTIAGNSSTLNLQDEVSSTYSRGVQDPACGINLYKDENFEGVNMEVTGYNDQLEINNYFRTAQPYDAPGYFCSATIYMDEKYGKGEYVGDPKGRVTVTGDEESRIYEFHDETSTVVVGGGVSCGAELYADTYLNNHMTDVVKGCLELGESYNNDLESVKVTGGDTCHAELYTDSGDGVGCQGSGDLLNVTGTTGNLHFDTNPNIGGHNPDSISFNSYCRYVKMKNKNGEGIFFTGNSKTFKMDDDVSSVKVTGGTQCKGKLYKEPNQKGPYMVVGGKSSTLNLNNNVKAIEFYKLPEN